MDLERDSFQISIAKNMQAVKVELDAKVVMVFEQFALTQLILSPSPIFWVNSEGEGQLFREANQCLDKFTKNRVTQQQDFTTFDYPPSNIIMFLYFDAISRDGGK